jgi:hypothetical protein
MPKVTCHIIGSHNLERGTEVIEIAWVILEDVVVTTYEGLDLSKGLLDRIEIWGVWR